MANPQAAQTGFRRPGDQVPRDAQTRRETWNLGRILQGDDWASCCFPSITCVS